MSTEDYIKDKMGEKYNVLLKFLNKLLTNMGKNHIQDAIHFKNIRRNELLTEENDAVYDAMKDEIHKYFGKYNLKYDQKTMIKHYLITLLKSMCNELFLNFESKSVRKKVDNKITTYVVYDICVPNK